MWTSLQTHLDWTRRPYTGLELAPLWIYKTYGLQGSALVAFRGPCDVPLLHLVDQADVLAEAPIAGDEMLHLVAELFGLPAEAGVLLQRLWMARIAEFLQEYCPGKPIARTGDDLWVEGRKLSVSICTVSALSVLIHIGLNLTTTGTPVPTAGLLTDGLLGQKTSEQEIQTQTKALLAGLAEELQQALLALCKVTPR